MRISLAVFGFLLTSWLASAQSNFAVTGAAIPAALLQQNYGRVPKGITGFDLNICNTSATKQSIVSSQIYQALAESNPGLQPIGRQMMLAAILHNQNRSIATLLPIVLNSITGVLSILGSTKYNPPTGLVAGVALGTISVQQIFGNFKPLLSADQVAKFEDQVLEPALVLDSGSCLERTVFATVTAVPAKSRPLNFRVK